MENDVREQLAAYAHEAWSGWMRYLFGKCSINEDNSYIIPSEYVANLWRLMDMPYSEMPESSKESDRAEADKMLAIINGKRTPTTPPPSPDSAG